MSATSAFLIPAFNPGHLLSEVLLELQSVAAARGLSEVPIVVVDDGSTDDTACVAEAHGATVLRHAQNQGKGCALQTGLSWAQRQGIESLVTLDADGQHPPAEAVRLLEDQAPATSMVLAVRDLAKAGAPRPNQLSNAFSNKVISWFGGEKLEDTQCGLRRYPVSASLALGCSAPGYAFESEIVLRAARRGLALVFVAADVIYPPEEQRLTYFDSVRDPARMVARVVWTALTVPHHRASRRWSRRFMWGALLALLCAPLWR